MRIYLTGFMGAGKTTYGKELAEEMGYKFLDLDTAIEELTKMTVSRIFEKKGEDFFREKEAEALLKTFKLENVVIATGGGAPCHYANMEKMNEHGTTVYLRLFENQLYNFLLPDVDKRPKLKGKTPEEVMSFVYQSLRERAFYYNQARIVIYPLLFTPKMLAGVLRDKE